MVKYELFRQVLDRETYYKGWEPAKLVQLTEELKDTIYEQYVIKCHVLQRDDFKCQNTPCRNPSSESLTIHHVKAKRNGGEDKPRNMVTVCDTCHKGYERAKYALTFPATAVNLPPHLRGHTFKLQRAIDEKAEWKKFKKAMKRYRKGIREQRSYLTMERLYELLKFMGWIQ
jgi:hypothetical protein